MVDLANYTFNELTETDIMNANVHAELSAMIVDCQDINLVNAVNLILDNPEFTFQCNDGKRRLAAEIFSEYLAIEVYSIAEVADLCIAMSKDIALTNYRITERQRVIKLINEKSFLGVCVNDTGGYTVGLSHLCGYELFLPIRENNIRSSVMGMLLNELAMLLKDGRIVFDTKSELPDDLLMHAVSKQTTRYIASIVEREAAIDELSYGLRTYADLLPSEYKVVRLVIGDINNLLPGETDSVVSLADYLNKE